MTGNYSDAEDMTAYVVLSLLAALALSFYMGSNDAANSIATAVGSNAISLRKAVAIGAVMEMLGATLLGASVSGTIEGASEKEDSQCWRCGMEGSKMALYIVAMFSSLLGAAALLIGATLASMPVSVTHAVVGAVTASSAVSVSPHCLDWSLSSGLGGVGLSWALSPFIAGAAAAALYSVTKPRLHLLSSAKVAMMACPPAFFVQAVLIGFLVAAEAPLLAGLPWAYKSLVAVGAGIAGLLTAWLLLNPLIRKEVAASTGEEGEAEEKFELVESTDPATSNRENERENGLKGPAKSLLRLMLIFVASCKALSHGANDVANAAGQASAIWHAFEGKCGGLDTPRWILMATGVCVSAGIVLQGWKVIETVGKKLTSLDIHQSWCIELATTISVLFASINGLPISTTHCQVGAVITVGALSHQSAAGSVQWHLVWRIVLTWLLTVPIAGFIGASFTLALSPTAKS